MVGVGFCNVVGTIFECPFSQNKIFKNMLNNETENQLNNDVINTFKLQVLSVDTSTQIITIVICFARYV